MFYEICYKRYTCEIFSEQAVEMVGRYLVVNKYKVDKIRFCSFCHDSQWMAISRCYLHWTHKYDIDMTLQLIIINITSLFNSIWQL